MTRPLFVLLIVSAAAVAAPVPKSLKKRPPLDGRWVTTERVEWGVKQTADRRLVWDIDGEKVSPFNQYLPEEQLLPAYTTAVVTISQPSGDELDVLYSDGPTQLVFRGRIRWDGDQLLIALGGVNKPRPTEVEAAGVYAFYRFDRMPAR